MQDTTNTVLNETYVEAECCWFRNPSITSSPERIPDMGSRVCSKQKVELRLITDILNEPDKMQESRVSTRLCLNYFKERGL